jgi:hypothetical protein
MEGLAWITRHYRRRSIVTRAHFQNSKMPEWSPLGSAPTDGSWIKVRGWDFGLEGSERHYAVAHFENANWFEANGTQLRYLTDWQELSNRPRLWAVTAALAVEGLYHQPPEPSLPW